MRRSLAGFVVALGLVAGCGRSANTNSTAPKPNATFVTRQEILDVPVDNLFDALQRVRPAFLRGRATAGRQAYPVVYVDGMRKGTIEYLRVIPSQQVNDVRFYSAIDATTRFGLNVGAGVVEVRLISR